MESWSAACITIGMRIPPAATTDPVAAQPSAQSVLAGDSFAVILSAASEEPVSVQPVTGPAAKGQTGQGSASRGTGQQAEAQAPSVQSNRSSRTSTVRWSSDQNDRTESGIDVTFGDQADINLSVGRSSTVATGRTWSPASNVTSLQSPAASMIASGTTSASPIAARATWSTSTFRAPIAGTSQEAESGEGLTTSAAQTQSDERVVNRKVSGQSGPQLPALHENGNSIGIAVVPQPIQVSASDAEKLTGQENGQSSKDGSSAVLARTATVAAATASHDLPPSPATQSTSNAAATDRNQTPQDPQTSAKTVDATVDADSAAPASAGGLPTIAAGSLESAAAQILQQSMALPIPCSALPNSAGVSSKGTGTEVLSNPTQKTDSNAAKPTNPDLVSAANSGTSKTKDEASGSADASTHNDQNAQADSSQTAASTPRVQDIAASHPQVQTIVSPAATHEATIAPRTSDAPADAFHLGAGREAGPAIDPDGIDSMPTSGVNAARLMQAMSESEMHIGLSSSGFGDISIRTSVSNHQMLAQISLDHSELSQAISAHVSSVQAKLSDDYGLRASIEINNLPFSHSGESGNPSRKERSAAAASLPGESAAAQGEERSGMGQEVFASAGNGTRLDIRA
jgi:hypothetical protein